MVNIELVIVNLGAETPQSSLTEDQGRLQSRPQRAHGEPGYALTLTLTLSRRERGLLKIYAGRPGPVERQMGFEYYQRRVVQPC